MTKLHDVRYWSSKFWAKENESIRRGFEKQAQIMNGPNQWCVDKKRRIIIEDEQGLMTEIENNLARRRDVNESSNSSSSSSSSNSSGTKSQISVTSLIGRSHSIRSDMTDDAEEFDLADSTEKGNICAVYNIFINVLLIFWFSQIHTERGKRTPNGGMYESQTKEVKAVYQKRRRDEKKQAKMEEAKSRDADIDVDDDSIDIQRAELYWDLYKQTDAKQLIRYNTIFSNKFGSKGIEVFYY